MSKVLKLENLKLEVLVSLCVKSELEGLTKSEKQKVANQAKKSLELIEEKKLRLLTSTGVILAGNRKIFISKKYNSFSWKKLFRSAAEQYPK